MVTFRNNNNPRRNTFRRNDRNFKSSSVRPKYGSSFSSNENFQRNIPGRNNHNASKLIEKYDNLAREALTSGDKILSENYYQHADHFKRILNEQESYKKERFLAVSAEIEKNNENNKVDEKIKKEETKEGVKKDTKEEAKEDVKKDTKEEVISKKEADEVKVAAAK